MALHEEEKNSFDVGTDCLGVPTLVTIWRAAGPIQIPPGVKIN